MITAAQLKQRFIRHVLDADTTDYPWWKSVAVFISRLVYAVVRDLARGRLTLQATSLVYSSLLSLVPMLAVSFSILKAFGVHSQLEPALNQFLAPLGPQSTEISGQIIDFVENVQVGVLGTLGLVLLLYTAVTLIQKIEYAFNDTWHIHRARTPTQLFSEYLSVLLVGPVLIFTAVGLAAAVFRSEAVHSLQSIQPIGALVALAATILPALLIIAAFAFLYAFIPNTRVQISSALAGGVVAGVLWQLSGWGFASVIATSSHYRAVYSAFASLILFMMWVYLSWLILLLGASITYYHQHPRQLRWLRREPRLSLRMTEWVALSVLALIAERYYHRQPPWTADKLAGRLHLPQELFDEVLTMLTDCGLLKRIEDRTVSYLPAVPLEITRVHETLITLRRYNEQLGLAPERLQAPDSVQQFMAQIETAATERFSDLNIHDLALSTEATTAAAGPVDLGMPRSRLRRGNLHPSGRGNKPIPGGGK
ncbi:MAG: YihY/virulence factor BrkB family protein [Nitrococcus sp.]|nr:YihY/virulence factor BrkB family protein [Nitrococcus sp.]